MLTDGLKSQNLEEQIKQIDVAELLERACATDAPVPSLADAPAGVPGVGVTEPAADAVVPQASA